MLEVDRRAFGAPPRTPDRSDSWVRAELERTQCAFDGGTLIGCSRAYSFELTMPGGACVPVAGVSSVAVQPTHRRRGVLTAMIGARARRRPASAASWHRPSPRRRASSTSDSATAPPPGASVARSARAHARLARPVRRLRKRAARRPRRGRRALPAGLRAGARRPRRHGLPARLLVARGVLGAGDRARALRRGARRRRRQCRRLRLLRDQGRVVRRLCRQGDVRMGPPGDESGRTGRAVGVRVRGRPRREDRRHQPAAPTSRCGSCSPTRARCVRSSTTTRSGCCRSTWRPCCRRARTRRRGSSRSRSSIPTARDQRFALDGGPDGSSCREQRGRRPTSPARARRSARSSWAATRGRRCTRPARSTPTRRVRWPGPTRCSPPRPLPATLTWF